MRVGTIDTETHGKQTFGRFCNQFDPEHFIVCSTIKVGDEAVQAVYNKDKFSEGILPGEAFGDLLERCDILVGQNIKFDLLWLWGYAPFQEWLANGGQIWDTKTVEYLLEGQDRQQLYNLDTLAVKYGGKVKNDIIGKLFKGKFTKNDELIALKKALQKKIKEEMKGKKGEDRAIYLERLQKCELMPIYDEQIEYKNDARMLDLISKAATRCASQGHGLYASEIPPDLLLPYAKWDTENTYTVFKGQVKRVNAKGNGALIKTYMEHILALCEFEYNGLPIDMEAATTKTREYQAKVDSDRKLVSRLLEGMAWPNEYQTFNPLSTTHISACLFGALLPVSRVREKLENGEVKLYKSGAKKGTPHMEKYAEDYKFKGFSLPTNISELVKGKKDTYSTNNEVLQKAISIGDAECQKFCKAILAIREHSKFLQTYLIGDKVTPSGRVTGQTGNLLNVHTHDSKMHPEFTHKAVTGRLASSNPNAQNFNKEAKSLVVAPDDYVIINADYSQLEVCLLAQVTGDTNLIHELATGVDLHVKLLSLLHPLGYEEILKLVKVDPAWALRRTNIKPGTYGPLYGQGARALSQVLGLTFEQTKELLDKKDAEYPEAAKFYAELQKHVEENAVATKTYCATVRYDLPGGRTVDDSERNAILKSGWTSETGKKYVVYGYPEITKYGRLRWNFDLPKIKNYPIQGLAADIVSFQVARLYRRILKLKHEQPELADKIYLIAEVHDSVTLLVHKDYVSIAEELVNNTLTEFTLFESIFGYKLKTPLKVDISTNKSWGDCK